MTALTASQTTTLVSQTSVPAPATTFAAVWYYAVAPSSLDASIISTSSLVEGDNTRSVVHYSLNCPSSDTPDNDFCRALGQYPAEFHYTQPGPSASTSHAEGIWTDAFGHGTTAWECALGGSMCAPSATKSVDPGCQAPVSASCTQTITNGQATASAITKLSPFSGCQAGQHSAVLNIIGGLEKLSGNQADWLPTGTWKDVGEYAAAMTSSWNSELSEYGCPTRSVWTAVPEETSDVEDGTASTTTGSYSPTGTANTTASGPAQTAGAAEIRGLGSLKVAALLGAGAMLTQILV